MLRQDKTRRVARGLSARALCAITIVAAMQGSAPASTSPAGGGAVLRVDKFVVGPTAVAPGANASFLVSVQNFGGAAPTGARVLDALPPGFTSMSWTCSGFNGATCATPSGNGPIDESLDGVVPFGGVDFAIEAVVAAAPPPFVTNTALTTLPVTASCEDGATPPCRAEATISTGSNLDVAFLSAPPFAQAGQAVQFVAEIAASTRAADGTIVRIPLAVGLEGMTWTCTATSGVACPAASGSGAVDQPVSSWAAGGRLTYTLDATVAAAPPAEIAQSALAIPPFGGSCGGVTATPPCVAVMTVPVGARIDVFKTGEFNGSVVFYSITLANAGADAGGSVFVDALPAGIATFEQWTCNAEGGAVCPQAAGSGAGINQVIATWPNGGTLNYQVTAQPDAAPPALVTNTASVTPPAGGRCANAAGAPPCLGSTTTPIVSSRAQFAFNDNFGYAAPGSTIDLVLGVGPELSGIPAGGQLAVPVPAGISAFEGWTCAAFGSATCPAASGAGAISETLAAIPGESALEFTITARIAAAAPVEVGVEATLQPPAGVGCAFDAPPPCLATERIITAPMLEVTKTATTSGLAPGGSVGYDILVRNVGVDASAVRIADPLPVGMASATWTCSSGYVSCPNTSGVGAIDEVLASLPMNASIAYHIDATVAASPPVEITNTVTVTTGDNAVCLDAVGASGAQPCVASVTGASLPLVELTQASSQTQVLLGGTARYTLTLRNLGTTTGAITLGDPLPSGITRFDWQCRGFAGATCPADSGSGALAETITSLVAGGRLVYTIDALVAVDAPASIVNIASVTPPAGGACNPVDCTATVVLPVSQAPAASIAVNKTAGAGLSPPGSVVTYTIDVRNLGAVTANNLLVEDPLPNGLSGMTWTCAGAECPSASGSGALAETLGTLAPFVEDGKPGPMDVGRVVYTVGATVVAAPPPVINNIVTLVPSGEDGCAYGACTSTASVNTGVVGEAVLTVETQPPATLPLVPGQVTSYSVGLVNTGNADAGATTFGNPVPTGFDTFDWTCTSTGTAKCPLAAGSGAIQAVVAAIPVGDRLTYAISATVANAPPATISNTTIVKPPAGASCVPVGCTSTLLLPVNAPGTPVLVLAKTADLAVLEPGATVIYTVSVGNSGSADAGPSQLVDVLPAGLDTFAWTCAATNDASCPVAAGNGSIAQTISLPVASSLTYTVQATVAAAPPASIANTASLTPAAGATCIPASCTITRTLPVAVASADIQIDKSAVPAAGTILQPGQDVIWTLRATNSGSASTAALTLVDDLPANVGNIRVVAGSGTTCSSASPTPGATLTCTIPAGFTGTRSVEVTATVAFPDAQGRLRNSLAASGADAPVCSSCTTVHPVAIPLDVAVGNARPFNAAGISGTLVDILNLSSTGTPLVTVTVEPASAQTLFGVYSGGCTATPAAGGAVVVACPSPPSAQGIQCSADTCTIQGLAESGAATVFVALQAQAGATVRARVAGDTNPGNDTITLPPGGNP